MLRRTAEFGQERTNDLQATFAAEEIVIERLLPALDEQVAYPIDNGLYSLRRLLTCMLLSAHLPAHVGSGYCSGQQ